MKTKLNFEDRSTKELLAKLDFEFFLKQNIEESKYDKVDTDALYSSYKTTLREQLQDDDRDALLKVVNYLTTAQLHSTSKKLKKA